MTISRNCRFLSCFVTAIIFIISAGCDDSQTRPPTGDVTDVASNVDADASPNGGDDVVVVPGDVSTDNDIANAGDTADGGDTCAVACVHGTCEARVCACDPGYSGAACDYGDGSVYHIVQGGAAVADIVVAEDATNTVKLAAKYFQQYVRDMSGASLEIGHAPGDGYDFHVYIGRSAYTDQLGVNAEGTENGGYKIVAGVGHLVLLGEDTLFRHEMALSNAEWDALTAPDTWLNTYPFHRTRHAEHDIWQQDGKGTMNAVYGFLYDQGMRWYYPSADGTIVPDKQNIAFPMTKLLKNPEFALRSFDLVYKSFGNLLDGNYPPTTVFGSRDEYFRWILSLAGTDFQQFIHGRFSHGIAAVTQREETRRNHPEYYSIWNGVRQDGLEVPHTAENLCSEELLAEAIRYAKTVFDTYEAEYVSIWPSDGLADASQHTAECVARATPERGSSGKLSDYVWEFVNNVAWAIHDDPAYGPTKRIFAGAYSTYQLIPEHLSDPRGLAPNIAIIFTKWRSHMLDDEARREYRARVNAWLDILPSQEVFMWDYYRHNVPERTHDAVPRFYPHAIADDLRFLRGKSSGEHIEIYTNWPIVGLKYDTMAAEALNTYITARLFWGVDQDVDALLEEYYELYYGPARDKMKALHEYSEQAFERLNYPEYLPTMRKLAEEALAIAGEDTVYGRRVSRLLGLINAKYVGENTTIDACQKLNSPNTAYTLSADVVSDATCFFIDESSVTLDCAGHTIQYGSNGKADAHGVWVDARRSNRGHYFKIKNCKIQGTPSTVGTAIQVVSANHAEISGNQIVAPVGIQTLNALDVLYKGNTVESQGIAMHAQFGGFDGPRGFVSASRYEDNVFSSATGYGGNLYRVDGDTVINNTFSSASNFGLSLFHPVDTLLKNNIFRSDTKTALVVTNPRSLTDVDNTIEQP